MSIEESMKWAKERRGDWNDLNETYLNSKIGGKNKFAAVTFAKTERPSFTGEVGKVDDDLIFHFWPSEDEDYSTLEGDEWKFSSIFPDALATSFIEVFKLEDRLCWDFVEEMNSWVVRASRFGGNPMADELANRLFTALQDRLER